MRICHVITRLIVGGAQENTLLTCRELLGRGHEVTLVAGAETGSEGSLLERARADGYRVELVGALGRRVDPIRDWMALQALRELLGSLQPQVVHTHSSKAGILGRVAARDVAVPIIVHTIHGMSFNRTQVRPVRWLYANLERYCADFTDRLISVAEAMTSQAVAAGIAGPERFVTIYSGMELWRFEPRLYDRQEVRRQLGLPAEAVVVATVARLSAKKGYEQLMPVMARVAGRDEQVHFVWIGDGPKRQEYEEQLGQLGLRERVRLVGLVMPERIAGLLLAADMLVHSSQWEGLPRAAVQALLMERPVVCFDIDGAPEVVRHGQTGLLVPLNDLGGLTASILELAGDPDRRRRYGRAGRQLCLERFDHRHMVDQIERVYLELANEKL